MRVLLGAYVSLNEASYDGHVRYLRGLLSVDRSAVAPRTASRRLVTDFIAAPSFNDSAPLASSLYPADRARATTDQRRRLDFDVITYFRARGDSFNLIASIGFWVGDDPTRALTARGLKHWYESELERRLAAKAAIR